ncbi:MAG: hypothetical protein ACI35T_07260 [Alistipes sp.]
MENLAAYLSSPRTPKTPRTVARDKTPVIRTTLPRHSERSEESLFLRTRMMILQKFFLILQLKMNTLRNIFFANPPKNLGGGILRPHI